jgi:putative transposase
LSVDFVSEHLASARHYQAFNIVDDLSRACVVQVSDFSISEFRLTREVDRLSESRQVLRTIVRDSGPDLTCKAMFVWAKKRAIKHHFLQGGKLTQSTFVESFKVEFREYYLDPNGLATIEDARATIDNWKVHYSHVRPYRSLGRKPTAVFAEPTA